MFYIHCNTDQVYSALICNSIRAFTFTDVKMQKHTLSFLSENAVCLFNSIQPKNDRQNNCDDVFYPVTLAVSLDNTDGLSKVYPFKINNGVVSVCDAIAYKEYTSDSDYLGLFFVGELPFSAVKQILFETDDKNTSSSRYIEKFRKPSSDLWFPEDLYGEINNDSASDGLSLETIENISKEADSKLSSEEISQLKKAIDSRSRKMAAAYYAIRETERWTGDDVTSNIDEYILSLVDDENGTLKKIVDTELEKIKLKNLMQSKPGLGYDSVLSQSDNAEQNLERRLFYYVLNYIMECGYGVHNIPKEPVQDIQKIVTDVIGEENNISEIKSCLETIDVFLHNTVDPAATRKKIVKYPVFVSLMAFLDSCTDDDYLNYGCENLSQYERRYAYIWFGILKGMESVDGKHKSNRELEYRLEQKIFPEYGSEYLVSGFNSSPVPFVCSDNKEENMVYGIKPEIKYEIGAVTAHNIISQNDDAVHEFYNLMVKNKKIKPEKYERYESPIKVEISCERCKDSKTHTYNNFADVQKAKYPELAAYAKSVPVVTDYGSFKSAVIDVPKEFEIRFNEQKSEIRSICNRFNNVVKEKNIVNNDETDENIQK